MSSATLRLTGTVFLAHTSDLKCMLASLFFEKTKVTMVLDPLSAFAVACNVLQIIEFGSKALTNAIAYRKAANGELPENRDLRQVLQSLKTLNMDLSASMPRMTGLKSLSKPETRLLEANKECLRLSAEFIDLLDKLKVKDQNAMLESLRMGFKTLWYKDKMNTIERALSQARDNLNLAFLVYMRYASIYPYGYGYTLIYTNLVPSKNSCRLKMIF